MVVDITNMIHGHSGCDEGVTFTIPEFLFEETMYAKSKPPLNAQVSVYAADGFNNPHFHFLAGKIDCCIMLFESRYFTHSHHSGEITDGKTRKLLDKWLTEECVNDDENSPIRIKGLPIWTAMVTLWNYWYNTNYDANIANKPNYRNIAPYKQRR